MLAVTELALVIEKLVVPESWAVIEKSSASHGKFGC